MHWEIMLVLFKQKKMWHGIKRKIIGEKNENLSHSLPLNTGNLLLMAFYKASYKVLQKDERNNGKPSCLQMSYTLR